MKKKWLKDFKPRNKKSKIHFSKDTVNHVKNYKFQLRTQ